MVIKKNKLKKEKDLPFFEKENSIQIVFRKKDIQHTTERERANIEHMECGNVQDKEIKRQEVLLTHGQIIKDLRGCKTSLTRDRR